MTRFEIVMSVLTGIYVVLTGFYAWISRKTLKAIEKQSERSEKQFSQQLAEMTATRIQTVEQMKVTAEAAIANANAAKTNADILGASQRPQLYVRGHDNPWKTVFQPEYGVRRILLAVSNIGLTTAYDCIWESWIELLPLPFDDFTSAAEHYSKLDRFSVYPNADPVIINVPINVPISDQHMENIRKLKLVICIRFLVKYRDNFSPERYASFGYHVDPRGWGFLPKYNDSN